LKAITGSDAVFGVTNVLFALIHHSCRPSLTFIIVLGDGITRPRSPTGPQFDRRLHRSEGSAPNLVFITSRIKDHWWKTGEPTPL
jgi:hypothetical protein